MKIIHRDINPRNILINNFTNHKDLELKLIDFGISTTIKEED